MTTYLNALTVSDAVDVTVCVESNEREYFFVGITVNITFYSRLLMCHVPQYPNIYSDNYSELQ